MKKLNKALDRVNEKYIEEAAKAERLNRNTARVVRNIAIPVVSAAAVAGLCLGMGKLGLFKEKNGVDLLPASSDTSSSEASTTQATTVLPSDITVPEGIEFPDEIPLVLRTQNDIESIIFGSQFPEMIYADENTAIFTEGVDGVYIYDFAAEEITFAADVSGSFELAFDDFPKSFGAPSWNGISLFSTGDGTPYCSVRYNLQGTYTGKGESVTEYYIFNIEELTLERVDNFELTDFDKYNGLIELPYDEKYAAISLTAAHYGGEGEFVYIRNAPTDIDLSPNYNMQQIELRRWTEAEVTAEPMDGGYYPFTSEVGKVCSFDGEYSAIDKVIQLDGGDMGEEITYYDPSLWLNSDGTFNFNSNKLKLTIQDGAYEVQGDLIRLDLSDEEYIIYRMVDDELYPCEAGAFAENSDSEMKAIAEITLPLVAQQAADDPLPMETAHTYISAYISHLCRGSSFDGEYRKPEFVNMLDGQWFISTYHGYDSWRGGTHYGIDIVADRGDPIYAAADGIARVPELGDDLFGGNGNTVVIMHDGGYFTVYAHADAIHVQDGEQVTAGQHIADVGSTGWSTGPHLHFEVYKGQTSEDPSRYLWFDGDIYDTNSVWYSIHCALVDVQLPDVPEDLWMTVDVNYDYSMTEESGNMRFTSLQGASVFAVADGEVIRIEKMKYEDGVCVVVKQTDGFVTLYRMVDECIVSEGDHIKAGLKIGQIGEWLEVVIEVRGNNAERVELKKDVFVIEYIDEKTEEVELCGYPLAESVAELSAPIDVNKGQIVEMMWGYGGYYEHDGIDIAAEYGTPVYAAKGGEVITAEWGEGGYGYCVKILHDDGMVTLYAHLSDITAKQGEHIDEGEQLGAVGSTGYTTGNVLHFEVQIDETLVNPLDYLPVYPISEDCVTF